VAFHLKRNECSLLNMKIFSCAIINVKSGSCSEDCTFCAQSAHYDTGAAAFPMLDSEMVLNQAKMIADKGADYVGLVCSGKKPTEAEFAQLLHIIEKIKASVDIKICVSIGMIDDERARILKEAGATSYHHNLETSRSYYPNICTTHGYEDNVRAVQAAQRAGLRVCSGGLLGLGESWEDREELANFLNELNVDSIPINFLMPVAGTPLEGQPLLSADEALKIISLFRAINGSKDIVIAGGRDVVLKDRKGEIFDAGANGVMIGDYLTKKGSWE
jgi:biotin synthase